MSQRAEPTTPTPCPADEDRSIWYMVHAYPLGGVAELIAAACDLQTRVGLEDLAMLERMEDPRLPVDVRVEVHTKADAGCLQYRRVCRELVDEKRQLRARLTAEVAELAGVGKAS